jgi:hypothetical protein
MNWIGKTTSTDDAAKQEHLQRNWPLKVISWRFNEQQRSVARTVSWLLHEESRLFSLFNYPLRNCLWLFR